MPITELSFVYNGFRVGEGSNYHVTDIRGFDPLQIREDTVSRAVHHGAFVYAEFLPERRPSLSGYCIESSSTNLVDKMNIFRGAFVPQRVLLPLEFKWPGEVEQRIYCIPRRSPFKMDLDFSLGYTEWAVEFLAGDPRIYANALSSLSFLTATAQQVANNAGTFPTEPQVVVTGPTTSPLTISNVTTGETLVINQAAAAGLQLEIDFAERKVTYDGQSKYEAYDPTTVWWDLEPGDNTVDVDFGGTGTAEFQWRSAWV